MNDHLQFDEDFDLYALGALDPEERAAFESHVESCMSCRRKLAAAQQRVGLLGLAAPALQPPTNAKQVLLERIRQESHAPARTPSSTPSWFAALWHQPTVAWACAVVIAVIALTLANSNYRLHHKFDTLQSDMRAQQNADAHDRIVADLLTSSDTQRVELKQAAETAHPEGRVYYHPNRGLLFYASNLPAPPSDHVYQLWLVPTEGRPISAGIFQPNPKGDASVVLPELPLGITAKAFAVTLEPSGGVPQPTGPKVLIGVV